MTTYNVNVQKYGLHNFRMRFKPQEDKHLEYHLSNIGNLYGKYFFSCAETVNKCIS